MALGAPILILLLAILGIAVGVFLLVFLIVPICKGIAWLVKHIFTFIFGMIVDVLRLVGSIITAIVMVPLILGNILLGRWSGATHYGRSLQSEMVSGGLSVYRVLIGHPFRFLLLSAVTEGLEKRLPAAVAAAPSGDRPSGRVHQFEGYTIVGSLQAGGSGGKLYVANPEPAKRAAFTRAGHQGVEQVVIKTFSLEDGSELPQIVRESRSLDAAKKLGLVLDHELTSSRFYYTMRYVPGQPLGLVTPQLHAASGGNGLDERHTRLAMGYVLDLLETLENYHRGGLWHKDVKPDNIIVDDRAHLVDFGLVTPLRSSMTLTTHGTEYFRDPELVRLALKGVKVSEVDGARFDVYAAGAVLYSIVENSFPAHGVLSQVSRRCPEAVKWVIRRAMADYDKRYPSSAAMALDLRTVFEATDPFEVKPIDLPSMQGQVPASPRPIEDAFFRPAYVSMQGAGNASPRGDGFGGGSGGMNGGGHGGGQAAAAAAPRQHAYAAASPSPIAEPRRSSPKISVRNWWTGEFAIDQGKIAASPAPVEVGGPVPPAPAAPFVPAGFTPIAPAAPVVRRSAADQLNSARARAAAARERVATRMASRKGGRKFSNEPNTGVFVALAFFLGACVLLVGGVIALGLTSQRRVVAVESSSEGGRGWATVTLPQVAALPGDTSVSIDASASHAMVTDVEEGAQISVGSQHALDSVNEGTAFVWIDLTRPLLPEHEAVIQGTLHKLEEMGVTITGDIPGVSLTNEERTQIVEQTAEVVAVTSALPWNSDEARSAISGWANQHHGIDIVVRFHYLTEQPVSAVEVAGSKAGLPLACSIIARSTHDEDEREQLALFIEELQQVIGQAEVH
jgi:serine/threonine protein kinase